MKRLRLLGLFAAVTCTVGCGDSGVGNEGQVAVYEVTGTVTFAGAPVADAAVTFSPQKEQPVATGRTNADGHYVLSTYSYGDGAAAGEYTVLITKTFAPASDPNAAPQHSADPAEAERIQAAMAQHSADGSPADNTSAIPERYGQLGASPLRAEVTDGGDNSFDFPLEP